MYFFSWTSSNHGGLQIPEAESHRKRVLKTHDSFLHNIYTQF